MGLDHDRRVTVGVMFLPHRVEGIVSLFDEIPDEIRAETEESQLLNNLVDQFLELWRVELERKEGRRRQSTRLAVVNCILPKPWRQRKKDLRIRFREMHQWAVRIINA